eukprot:scaffold63062_cov70-Phaeocystis_antarctica.AAC.5
MVDHDHRGIVGVYRQQPAALAKRVASDHVHERPVAQLGSAHGPVAKKTSAWVEWPVDVRGATDVVSDGDLVTDRPHVYRPHTSVLNLAHLGDLSGLRDARTDKRTARCAAHRAAAPVLELVARAVVLDGKQVGFAVAQRVRNKQKRLLVRAECGRCAEACDSAEWVHAEKVDRRRVGADDHERRRVEHIRYERARTKFSRCAGKRERDKIHGDRQKKRTA